MKTLYNPLTKLYGRIKDGRLQETEIPEIYPDAFSKSLIKQVYGSTSILGDYKVVPVEIKHLK